MASVEWAEAPTDAELGSDDMCIAIGEEQEEGCACHRPDLSAAPPHVPPLLHASRRHHRSLPQAYLVCVRRPIGGPRVREGREHRRSGLHLQGARQVRRAKRQHGGRTPIPPHASGAGAARTYDERLQVCLACSVASSMPPALEQARSNAHHGCAHSFFLAPAHRGDRWCHRGPWGQRKEIAPFRVVATCSRMLALKVFS